MEPETLPDKSPPGMMHDITRLLREEGKLSEEKIQDVVKMRGKTGNTLASSALPNDGSRRTTYPNKNIVAINDARIAGGRNPVTSA